MCNSGKEIIESKSLSPASDEIIKVVCKYYDVNNNEIFKSRRGIFNEPRNIAIYLVRKMRRDPLLKIGNQFSINSFSSVSSIINRLEKRIKSDEALSKRVDNIKSEIIKSQRRLDPF